MAQPGLRIEGLRAFQRDLTRLDTDMRKELRDGMKKAADTIAGDARASFGGGDGVAPKVAASIRASATQTSASISLGGAAWPYALGAEFGGRRRPTTQQFRPWRGSGASAGYSLFPAIRKGREHLMHELDALFVRLATRAFPE